MMLGIKVQPYIIKLLSTTVELLLITATILYYSHHAVYSAYASCFVFATVVLSLCCRQVPVCSVWGQLLCWWQEGQTGRKWAPYHFPAWGWCQRWHHLQVSYFKHIWSKIPSWLQGSPLSLGQCSPYILLYAKAHIAQVPIYSSLCSTTLCTGTAHMYNLCNKQTRLIFMCGVLWIWLLSTHCICQVLLGDGDASLEMTQNEVVAYGAYHA